ncbi:hypothetical protein DY245_03930 [Streptomyces inhibens]|uniref:Uncharacterized protein n=1 Tax=Streptomyces inhibens TaxID=2293571 RepID=A0A371QA17_STRIH|nr:hypothetical protein [Streptomyces inhibens]REK91540.1 hypothetical protein DY245_03930 [Streptomyces inhibens]
MNLYHEFYEYAESIRDHMQRAMKDEDAAATERNEVRRKRLTDSARLHRMIASDTYADASHMIHEMLDRGIDPPRLHTYAAIFAELANDYMQLETIPDELLKERE